jgi:hypothetical protein
MGTTTVTTLPETLASRNEAIGDTLKPVVGATTPVGVFTFTLKSFKITETRALHNDTDYVSFSVVVGTKPPTTVVKSMGDVDNGTHEVNLSVPNIAVLPSESVALTYSIVNAGGISKFEQQLLKWGESAAQQLGNEGVKALGELGNDLLPGSGPFIDAIGQAAWGWLDGKIDGFLTPGLCNGPVAGGDKAYSGAQLAQQTADGKVITTIELNKGTNSPDGCGSNSRYYVTWSISGPAQSTGGGQPSGGGGPVPSPGNPPHRQD